MSIADTLNDAVMDIRRYLNDPDSEWVDPQLRPEVVRVVAEMTRLCETLDRIVDEKTLAWGVERTKR